ncbi:hypothetical protein D187_007164 [Cystobacter fuscus DSM 2262]|uniref:Uncharacterized protein n=1 Tax=Cystobacter fuscus (strain ATCC 25194 / DSM 2262 / NBRC 100088 / M29) TaxID=1242864 RepID=S9NYV6_CYSF2|nr:hypothetical protein D187_007164 [Cystobacter fuscus DSM 2262]
MPSHATPHEQEAGQPPKPGNDSLVNSPGESLWSVNVTPFSHRVVKPFYTSKKSPGTQGGWQPSIWGV